MGGSFLPVSARSAGRNPGPSRYLGHLEGKGPARFSRRREMSLVRPTPREGQSGAVPTPVLGTDRASPTPRPGLRAKQTFRPCSMSRWLRLTQCFRGTTAISSRSITFGSRLVVSPGDARAVSRGCQRRPPRPRRRPCPARRWPSCGRRPLSAVRASRSAGTSPPCSATR